MTSIASESVATILCTSKQTRFHIESPNYRELEIDGIFITVTSGGKASGKTTTKGKSKAKAEGIEILNNAKLKLKEGQRYALVGRNGTGKSTLLKAIAEKLIPGIPEGTRIALLQQSRLVSENDANPDSENGPASSVLEEVIERATAKQIVEQEIKILSEGVNASDSYAPVRALRQLKHHRNQQRLFRLDKDARLRSGARGLQARKALVAYEKVVAESNTLLEQTNDDITPDILQAETQEAIDMLADLQIQVDPAHVADIESQAKKILTGLGFSEALMEKPIASLSGGWHMRASLATALLQETDILILDEPTNFLDLLGIIWLQRYLQGLEDTERAPTLVLVSHDRDFISVCTDLIILKDKQLVSFHGDLPTYEASQSERKIWLTKMKEAQDKQKAHIEKSITANIKAGKANDDQNKLRQAKSRQKKLDDRWGMSVGQRGGRFKLNRDLPGYHLTSREDIDIPPEDRPVVLCLPETLDLRFPGPLISLEKVAFRYSPKVPLIIQDITLSVGMGDRIGILGLNGAGKSTLVKMLVEETRPSSGTLTTHPRLRLGYYSQHAVDALQALGREEPSLTALALLTREVEAQSDEVNEGELRGHLGKLGLPGRFASDVPVMKLSGGQVVRVELARLLWRQPHCLILDEVTTHLDYETVTALREVLRDWEGAVILVSHDRWFMRGVVEGARDEDDEGSEEDDDDEASPRRRVVYRLKGGKLSVLENGVEGFEQLMEKRAKKILQG
ncbi:P-loop containing nucleoside triphosphate hydrolase protein [Dactylonectria macrodidyma]|uniref:P-loop containing nucleoside triphosphate hydrolase protein n=1 Tax=Dactylonectria macrodidyma TaxID=307937 RepID=A0A9P9FKA8_9HYPO|nr:P-loop containing nucleoside triphosphate hydrolase protein [Dactylonectria macrodidyma]